MTNMASFSSAMKGYLLIKDTNIYFGYRFNVFSCCFGRKPVSLCIIEGYRVAPISACVLKSGCLTRV